ncbi:histidine triad nucleotide-binding protein [Candidatus Gottesmanbacteria bacterium RIFCSPHIGHO2_02_FULL_39_14]|uniref:Histidine triad nucleotide-binding protein n=2 Tax=Candidatus Gottesmaniibacteriota TaxID=1752720 RepID=A0A1F5ZW65_9BACT|nr:MAG: histidine triad nucleotide-binding protein [Candidatus Gottesmanbacteria bacterium RBG_16_38_7b]OGG16382.1 MAG: histidine triad nucleotide-binding protein [Candidatus Gottesmanbacteria bacterium RIFCSPHIGHO2_02_FULL_39_14]
MTDCIFCKIIKGEIPAKKVYEDKSVIAIYDINPKAPVHILIIPKKHISSLMEINKGDKNLIGGIILRLKTVAQELGLDKSGYKVVVNNGPGSGQLVFHLHFHLLGGWITKAGGWRV